MTLTQAFNILRHYQLWRLGDEITELKPEQLTEAISIILQEQKKIRYSEEEVLDLIQSLSMNIEFNSYGSVHVRTARYFLEQYKNKL
jgi:hypothetical protein